MNIYCRLLHKAFVTLIIALSPTISNGNTQSNSVLVGVAEWPPWKIFEKGAYQGIDVDLLQQISNVTGIQFTFKRCSWHRCILLVKEGQVDLVTGMFKRPEREEFVDFIEPSYTSQKVAFYSNINSKYGIARYEDLYEKQIGVVSGSVYFDQFDNDLTLKRVLVTKDIQLVKMLKLGRLDLAIGEEVSFDYLIDSEGYGNQIIKSELRFKTGEEMYLAMSKKSRNRHLIPKISQAIQSLRDSNTVESIIYKHTHSNTP